MPVDNSMQLEHQAPAYLIVTCIRHVLHSGTNTDTFWDQPIFTFAAAGAGEMCLPPNLLVLLRDHHLDFGEQVSDSCCMSLTGAIKVKANGQNSTGILWRPHIHGQHGHLQVLDTIDICQ